MAKKKPAKQAAEKLFPAAIPISFPAEHFEAAPEELKPLPVELPPVPDDFKVACKITSLGTRYWSGVVFVALESTDGRNLLDLLRKDQEVTLHYTK